MIYRAKLPLSSRSARAVAVGAGSGGRIRSAGHIVFGFEFSDAGPRGVEFVLQPHDPGGGIKGHALVEQLPHAGSELELAPRVAAMTSTGAMRCENPGRVEATQERRLHLEQLRGLTHGDRGIVLIVEPAHTTVHRHPDPFTYLAISGDNHAERGPAVPAGPRVD